MRNLAPVLVFVLACATPINIHVGSRIAPSPAVGISNPSLADGDPLSGRNAFVSQGCIECHRVENDPGLPWGTRASMGPMLRTYDDVRSAELAHHIRNAGRPMSETARKLTARQLVDVVAYLKNPRLPRS